MDAASGDNDLLFKLGFEPHPQTGSRLDALVKQVETAYDRITKLDNEIGSRLTTTVDRVGKTAADTATATVTAKTTAATEARVVQVEREIDSLKEKTKTLVEVLQGETEYTDRMKTLSEARRVAMESEAAQMRSYFDQLKTDLKDIAAYQAKHGQAAFDHLAAGGAPASSEDAAAQMAIARAEIAAKQAAALQAKAEKEAEAARRKEQAAKEKAERAAEAARQKELAAQEKAAKEAEKIRLKALRDAEREAEEETAFKQRIWMRELAMKKAQEAEKRAAEHNSTLERIDAYAKEQSAHDKAINQMAQGRAGFVEGMGQTASAIGKLSRAVVVFGLAQGEDLDRVIQKLAAVQTAVDTIAGTGELIRGVTKAWDSLRMITLGSVAAKEAEIAASRIAMASSAQLQAALNAESLAAGRAATAHQMLAVSRTGGAVGGAVATAATTATATAAGAASGGMFGRIGGAAMAGAAALPGAIKAAGTALLGLLGPIGVATAGIAAVGGAFYWLATRSERLAAAQAEERTKRMEHQLAMNRLERQHLDNLAKIREGFETRRRQAQTGLADQKFQTSLSLMRTPQERSDAIDQRVSELMGARSAAERELRNSRAGEDDAAASQKLLEIQERLKDALNQQLSIKRELAAENRRMTMDEIKGIEDVINARIREKKELEDSHKTAKERFGALSELEQQRTIDALKRARQNPNDISQVDADLISRNIDTDESRRLISQRNIERANRAGFDVEVDAERLDRTKEAEQEIRKQIGVLAEESGQSEAELRKRADAGKGASVEIVDRTQLQVQINGLEDQLFERIAAAIDEAREAMYENLQRRANLDQAEKVRQETQEHQKKVNELNAQR